MADDAETLQRRASQLFRAGDVAAAIPAYQALLAVRPDLPNSWFNLAMLQRRARRYDAALEAYAQALALGIAEPEEAHLRRAVIFSDHLGDSERAEAELETALALNPDYVAALLNLGNLHEDRGDWAAARAACERVLALQPNNALALARLSGLAEIGGADDPLLARMQARMASPAASAADCADLGFALGAALDRTGAYNKAFIAYAAANEASREMTDFGYDRRAQEQLVDRLIAAFPEPAAGAGADSPVFICGMFRSGSTLAEQILARHSRIVAGGELDALPALIDERLQPYPEAVAGADLGAVRDAYLAEAAVRRAPGRLLTDKRPDNFLHIGLIKRLFPDAKIVHTVRDPLDTSLSVYFLHAGPALAYASDLDDIAHYFGQYRRLMAHWRALYPDDIFDFDYDRLVREPRPAIAELLGFLGLPWEDGVLRHQEGQSAVRTASNRQVREPLYRGSSGRWQNYRQHLDGLREAL
ncbi:MAG: sulfotransferase [Pseudomonadota bacterium]